MKKVFSLLLVTAVAAVMVPFQVLASSTNTVIDLNADGEKAGVQITMPENTGKNITALELRINVENLADANVGFEFSDFNATVKETRYRQESNELVVYVAGGKQMFSNDTTFLGYVVADSDVEGNVVLSVKENSLQVADGIYGIFNHAVEPATAELKTQGTPDKPDSSSSTSKPDSSSQSTPDSTPDSKPDSSSESKPSSSSAASSETPSASKPADSSASSSKPSAIEQAVAGQQSKKENQASSKPKASSQNADVDKEEESSEAAVGENKASSLESPAQTASSSAASQSQAVQSEAQKAGNTTIWVIAVVLIVVAAAAVAVIVIRKKKS